MKVLLLSCLLVLGCARSSATKGAVLPAPSATATPRDMNDDIRDLLDAQKTAWNRGDIEGFMASYERSEELVFTSGGEIRRGWQTTLDRYRKRYGSDSSTMGTLDFEVLEIQALGNDGAMVLGRWKLDGLAKPLGGVFSLGLRRGPEGWKIVHDHTSSDPAED